MKIGRLLVALALVPVLGAWTMPVPEASAPIHVKIDIEPGSSANDITLPSGMRNSGMTSQMVPVAILSTKSFNATDVRVSTLSLGNNSTDAMASSSGYGAPRATIRDVNGDGLKDMVVRFPVAMLKKDGALTPSTTQLCLNGKTDSGQSIHGCDSVHVLQ